MEPAADLAARTPRFPAQERQALLLQPGVGERVLQRLERAGYASIDALLAHGIAQAVERTGELRNRSRALQRAVAALRASREPA